MNSSQFIGFLIPHPIHQPKSFFSGQSIGPFHHHRRIVVQ
ncbi:hypothetical protein M8C21_003454 [Ambrosia artemisiifolia]|uniref:Uncharacterized protein n=1 Tax=Ambrosia artemisiifolia TaxID=4212 RepID=A0AAD5G503_AMBAR|nr:hypothetical protein M8C21_003454 [Ambrosia artemisiifolia]